MRCLLRLMITAAVLCLWIGSAHADLIAHYTFDSNTLDSGPNGYHGLYTGAAAAYIEGYDGTPDGAIVFSGTGPGLGLVRLQIPDDGTAKLPIVQHRAFSISMWVRGAPQRDKRMFSEGSTATAPVNNTTLYNIGTDNAATPSGRVNPWIRNNAGQELIPHTVQSHRAAFDDTWHHIAWVDDNGECVLYIDGVRDTQTFRYTRFAYPSAFTVHATAIGGILRTTEAAHFIGAIDDVKLFDHALTEAEVAAMIVNVAGCPPEGDPDYRDTVLTQIDVDGPPDDIAGWYTVSAEATDGTGDPIQYLFVFTSDEGGYAQFGPSTSATARVLLTPGTWNLTVTAVDKLLCPRAEEATMTVELVVDGSPRLIGHWALDGDILDAAYGNHGTFFGDEEPTFTEGFDGTPNGAILLDGVDDIVRVTQNAGLPIYTTADAYTVSLWVKGPTQNDMRVFAEASDISGHPLVNIGTTVPDPANPAAGKAKIYIRGTTTFSANSGQTAFDDTWHHIAWVDDNGKAVMYIDGVRDPQSFTYTRPFMTVNTTSIGGIIRAAQSHFFAGAIDDVRIYNYALTQEEILGFIPEPDDCPAEGDTHVQNLAVEGPEGDVEGVYTVTCTATDDSGDPIFYIFTLRDEEGAFVRQVGPQAENTATLTLTAGIWTVDVFVYDNVWCRAEAEDARASVAFTVWLEAPALVAHWPLDGTLDDAVGENNGALIGYVQNPETLEYEWVAGTPVYGESFDCAPEGALVLDGDTSQRVVKLTEGGTVTSRSMFTIAFWIKGPAGQEDRRVFSESSSASNTPLFNIGTHNQGANGALNIFIRNDANTTVFNHLQSTAMVFDDTWRHVAWVDDNGQVVLYIDGQPDATDFTYTRSQLTVDTTSIGGILREGRLPGLNAATHFVQGAIADFRVYNYPLPMAEVETLYGEGPTHCCPAESDTRCLGLDVETGPEAGMVTVTCTAVDDSGDPIIYAFSAELNGTVVEPVAQTDSVAQFMLTEGVWTITVSVTDDPLCPLGPDAVCTVETKVCPIAGDTHCVGLEIEGGPGEDVYTVTCTAVDDSGDPIIYTFSAESNGTVLEPDTQTDNVAQFMLTEGVWTITVSVTDDPDCPPGPEGICTATVTVTVGTPFRRGDANADGALDIADAIFTLSYLFAGGALPPCLAAADANADGGLDIADAIAILSHLFAGSGPLPDPFLECGVDPSDDGLGCEAFPPCE